MDPWGGRRARSMSASIGRAGEGVERRRLACVTWAEPEQSCRGAPSAARALIGLGNGGPQKVLSGGPTRRTRWEIPRSGSDGTPLVLGLDRHVVGGARAIR